MFDWLFDILGVIISFFNTITGSYALALILYALIFKIVFLPFSIKQQKNQVKMAKLAPKIELIKAKYRGRTDQVSMQRQQQEIMDLQQKEGASPFSGCLPLLIQLPIIMLLYTVIQNPLSYIAKETDIVTEYNSSYSSESFDIEDAKWAELVETYGDKLYEKNSDGSKKEVNGKPVFLKINPINELYDVYGITGDAKQRNEINLINYIYKDTTNADGSERTEGIELVNRWGIDFDTIPDLRVFGVNLADTPDLGKLGEENGWQYIPLVIIPFLAAISSWLSMFLMRKFNGNSGMNAGAQDEQTAKSMQIMDLIMPLMTLFIAFGFSGMLGLYWVYQSLLGILQSFILTKAMPLPKYTEDELREMRREQKEAERAARRAARTIRTRSLHYIDEDDYDELPEAPESATGGKKSGGSGALGDAPEIKD